MRAREARLTTSSVFLRERSRQVYCIIYGLLLKQKRCLNSLTVVAVILSSLLLSYWFRSRPDTTSEGLAQSEPAEPECEANGLPCNGRDSSLEASPRLQGELYFGLCKFDGLVSIIAVGFIIITEWTRMHGTTTVVPKFGCC